jgi:hypothetical protein
MGGSAIIRNVAAHTPLNALLCRQRTESIRILTRTVGASNLAKVEVGGSSPLSRSIQ